MNYHVAIHYRHNPTEVYDEQYHATLADCLNTVAKAITYPNDVLYIVVLPC